MKSLSILFLVILQIAFNVGAQECEDESLSFYEMRNCTSSELGDLNQKLDLSLVQLKKLITSVYSKEAELENNQASASEVIGALNSAQHLWRTFINSDCEYTYQAARGGNGTGAPYAANRCVINHIKKRLNHVNSEIVNLQDW